MTHSSPPLDYYKAPAPLTAPGRFAKQLESLPDDAQSLVRIVQGLLIYDVVAADFYSVKLSQARQQDIHLRGVSRMLDAIVALDPRPIGEPRPKEKRIAGRCDHYTRLLTAMLRAKRIPARARCGFASYFNPGRFEDHWVCEYWRGAEARWVLVDAQLDDVWRAKLRLRFDPLDVPRAQFLVAGEAWHRCRTGEADPAHFGISFANLFGLWFVAGNLARDMAALNKVETLPWDVWGSAPGVGAKLEGEQLGFYDELARLTRQPDASFAELRARYDADDRLRVPERVFNAVREREERVDA
jgi:hypothetical protein